ncbi:MAG TPA: MmgE/PrpD family protein [Dehalococcoidia bacterium]|nr:MmgE/PrpD family protein [Dehalococcoidia bacterium]
MSSTTKGTPIEELSTNILNTRFENLNEATLENAKNRIIDVLGCVIGGAKAAGNPALVGLIKEWGGKEEATVLAWGGKVPACNAAMVNSIMARSFDFEVVGAVVESEWIGSHISGTTVPTALAMGEATGIDGKGLITALLVGDNVAARIIASSGFSPNKAWDITGTINAFGATAVTGRLLGLNKRQMRNAFGIVLNQLAGSMQNCWDGTTSFKLQQGISARNGIFAAQLAKAGWTGLEDALFSKFGYYQIYTDGCTNPEILTKDLGKKYYAEAHFKPYSCCGGLHAAIDCALAIAGKHNINADDIEEIVLYVSERGADGFFGQPFRIGPFPHANAAFNLRYAVADALLRKSVEPEHFSEESIRDPKINALISKVKLAESPGVPMLGARLKVKMKDGRDFSESVDNPKGFPFNSPMSRNEINDKFRSNVDFSQTVTERNAEKALKLLENLEELDNVNKIVELLVP